MKGSLWKLKKVALYATIAGCMIGASKMNAKAAQVIPNGVYMIASAKDTGFSLEIKDWDFNANSRNIVLGATNKSVQQAFRFTYANDGSYYIRSVSSSLLLEADSNSATANIMAKHPANYDDATKKWIVEKQSDGSFVLYNKASYVNSYSCRMEVGNAWVDKGSNVGMFYRNDAYQRTQRWRIVAMPKGVDEMQGYYPNNIGQYMVWWAKNANSRGYDAYMMDLYPDADKDGSTTYWSMATYYLNCDGFLKKVGGKKILNTMVGYGGIQDHELNRGDFKIHSMWDMKYKDKNGVEKTLSPVRVYPKGDSRFDTEGNGSSSVIPYNITFRNWYRALVRCWTDSRYGTTFVGMWVQNKVTGRWDLISYYNTGLYDAYLTQEVSGFMENFGGDHWWKRSAQLRNFYFLDHDTKKWVSTDKINIYPEYKVGRVGSHRAMTVNGSAYVETGIKIPDQTAYDLQHAPYGDFSVSSGSINDTKVAPRISSIGMTSQNGAVYVNWTIPNTSNPQLSYSFTVLKDGKTIYTDSATRPEVNSVCIGRQSHGKYNIRLTVTDVFGNKTTESRTVNYY